MKKILTVAGAVTLALWLTGCQPTTHPNQINDFDGRTFDSMVLAHSALMTLRPQVQASYASFIPQFNQTAGSYRAAFDSYAVYRTAPVANTQQLTMLTADLAASVVALENAFTAKLPVSPDKRQAIRAKAQVRHSRAMVVQPRYAVSLADILGALQVGATIAEGVPQASAYAQLAAALIQAAQAANSAAQRSSGSAIDLTMIMPVDPIPAP